MFLTYISEYKERYGFHLYAYALMRNHFHLLMEVGDIPLSRIMQSLLFRFTRYFINSLIIEWKPLMNLWLPPKGITPPPPS